MLCLADSRLCTAGVDSHKWTQLMHLTVVSSKFVELHEDNITLLH